MRTAARASVKSSAPATSTRARVRGVSQPAVAAQPQARAAIPMGTFT